jgi:hypothetical protein
MIIDEHLTVSEAERWRVGAISYRDAARLSPTSWSEK